MSTTATHWKSLYQTDRELYQLCYERTVEGYGSFYENPEDAPARLYFALGPMEAELTLGEVDDEARNIFGWGGCSFFAMALHKHTGLPLALFTSPEARGADWTEWEGHVALALPDGNFLDINGVVNADEINARYRFSEPVVPTLHDWESYLETQFGTRDVSNPYRILDPLEVRMLQHFAELVVEQSGIAKERG